MSDWDIVRDVRFPTGDGRRRKTAPPSPYKAMVVSKAVFFKDVDLDTLDRFKTKDGKKKSVILKKRLTGEEGDPVELIRNFKVYDKKYISKVLSQTTSKIWTLTFRDRYELFEFGGYSDSIKESVVSVSLSANPESFAYVVTLKALKALTIF